jgi:hypothetical protein
MDWALPQCLALFLRLGKGDAFAVVFEDSGIDKTAYWKAWSKERSSAEHSWWRCCGGWYAVKAAMVRKLVNRGFFKI